MRSPSILLTILCHVLIGCYLPDDDFSSSPSCPVPDNDYCIYGCDSDEPCTIGCRESQLKEVWRYGDGEVSVCIVGTLLHGDKVLYRYGDRWRANDKHSGELLWETVVNGAGTSLRSSHIMGDRLFSSDSKDIYCFDIATGDIIWHVVADKTDSRMALIGAHLYKSAYPDMASHDTTKVIQRFSTENGAKRIVTSYTMSGDINTFIGHPSGYVNANGDELLITGVSGYYIGNATQQRADLIAYNLTRDSMEWVLEDYFRTGGIPHAPTIAPEARRVYVKASCAVHCLDADTGEELWTYSIPDCGATQSSRVLLVNDVAYISEGAALYAVNASTGTLMWEHQSEEYYASFDDLSFHEDILYGIQSSHLTAVDVTHGRLIWSELSPDHMEDAATGFDGKVAIDSETGRVYAADDRFMYCFEPPEL